MSVIAHNKTLSPGHERKPKLLFLAHPFPPAHTIGAVRTWNIARHLARLGWQVTVVTPRAALRSQVDNVREVEAGIEREGIRMIYTGHRWRCLYPSAMGGWKRGLGRVAGAVARRAAQRLGSDQAEGWIKPALRACRHLTAADVDVILASGKPFATFELARRLSVRLQRPYVVDYRDPWTSRFLGISNPPVRASVVERERSLLAGAAAITMVSPSWAQVLREYFVLSRSVHAITNGYDPEDAAGISPLRFDHFAIVYAGTFYPPRRVVTPLLLALQKLQKHPVRWVFHYYGLHEAHVAEEAAKLGLSERVVFHGYVPRRESMAAMRGASAAVAITAMTTQRRRHDEGMIPAKLFELIALRAPFLFIGPPRGDAAEICREAGGGEVFGSGETDRIAAYLAGLMDGRRPAFRSGENYSWPVLARKFDRLLLQVAGLEKAAEPVAVSGQR
jgi:glycosyltransferase involved in cell wall biosynthesis